MHPTTLTPDEIERRRPYRPSDMLRNVSGVRVDTDDGDGRPVIRMGRTAIMMAPGMAWRSKATITMNPVASGHQIH